MRRHDCVHRKEKKKDFVMLMIACEEVSFFWQAREWAAKLGKYARTASFSSLSPLAIAPP